MILTDLFPFTIVIQKGRDGGLLRLNKISIYLGLSQPLVTLENCTVITCTSWMHQVKLQWCITSTLATLSHIHIVHLQGLPTVATSQQFHTQLTGPSLEQVHNESMVCVLTPVHTVLFCCLFQMAVLHKSPCMLQEGQRLCPLTQMP